MKEENPLHARLGYNYVANARYLYDVAKYIYAGNSLSTSFNNAINRIPETYRNRVQDKISVSETGLNWYINYYCPSNGVRDSNFCSNSYYNNPSTDGKRKNTLIVLGILIHLLGDITAHQTVIPKSAYEENYTTRPLINDYTKSNTLNKNYTKFHKDDYKNGNETDAKNAFGTIRGSVLGAKKFFKSPLPTQDNTKYSQVYEDNANFMRSRFGAAMTMIDYALTTFNYSFFDPWTIAIHGVGGYSEFNYKLSKLKTYLNTAGYSNATLESYDLLINATDWSADTWGYCIHSGCSTGYCEKGRLPVPYDQMPGNTPFE